MLLATACGQKAGDAGAPAATAAPPPLPLTTAATPASALAPLAAQLPKAPRPRIVRVASASDEYAYVDQAEAMGEALDAAPPDYTYDYDGVRPWVWRTSQDDWRLSEPIEGGYRVYYFRRGAAYPYLIQDPRYAYGFDDGQLAAVYGPSGALLPDQYMQQLAEEAGRYLARARALHDAALHADRQAVAAQAWAERSATLLALQAAWSRQQQRDLEWSAYHDQHQAQFEAYYGPDRTERHEAAQQFATWRASDFQGPPPPPPGAPGFAPQPHPGVVAGAAVGVVAAGAAGALLNAHHRDQSQAPTGEIRPGRPVEGPAPATPPSRGPMGAMVRPPGAAPAAAGVEDRGAYPRKAEPLTRPSEPQPAPMRSLSPRQAPASSAEPARAARAAPAAGPERPAPPMRERAAPVAPVAPVAPETHRIAAPRAEAPGAAPRAVEPRAMEPRALEPRALEPRAVEPRAAEPRAVEPRGAEPRAVEAPVRSQPAPPAPKAPPPAPARPAKAAAPAVPARPPEAHERRPADSRPDHGAPQP